MLKQIELTNFRSFKGKQVFTMEALPPSSLKEHPEHIIPVDGFGVLKLGSIYGPNGSGKSNLIRALSFFDSMSSFYPYEHGIVSPDLPFAGSSEKETSLSYTFINGKYEIVLSFSYVISDSFQRELMGNAPFKREFSFYNFKKEKLSFRKVGSDSWKDAYVREKKEIKADGLLKEIGINSFAIREDQLLVNFVFKQFSAEGEFFSVVASAWKEIHSFTELGIRGYDLLSFVSSKSNCEYLAKKLNSILNNGISSVHYERNDSHYSRINDLKFDHVVGDKKYTLSFYDESDGTQKLTSIIASIRQKKVGKIFYADDFDAHLHPAIIQAILRFFGSEENANNQFIFNSHDILNMDSEFFRRDEIWFTTLDEDNATKLYALSDLTGPDGRVIRNDKKYSKQYLEGKYGADPFIKRGLHF